MLEKVDFTLLRCHRGEVGTEWQDHHAVDDEGRLYLPVAGEAWLDCGRGYEALVPGRAVMIPPGVPRGYRCERWLELYWFHFRAVTADGMDLFAIHGWASGLDLEDAASWYGRFDRLLALSRREDAAAVLEADGLVRQLVAPFLREAVAVDDELDRLRSAMARAEEHLDGRVTVAGMARAAGWSPAHFSRRFRARLGRPPMTWVRERRVARARELLRDTGSTLATVAEACGFTDGFHLSKVFKALEGTSPSAWRRGGGAVGP